MPAQEVAAIVLEPIQGEGGYVVPPRKFFEELAEVSRRHEILLVCDEVQSGMGRTGTLFAYEQLGVAPDIMTLAKGLGGGLPIGACLATDPVAAAFTPGTHASTFGGNPLACAAALAVFEVLLEGKVLEQGRRMGEYLAKGLNDIAERLPVVEEARGLGLLQGLELTIDGKPVAADCLARGLLINCTAERVLRFIPPLIIAQREIDRLLETLSAVLSKRV